MFVSLKEEVLYFVFLTLLTEFRSQNLLILLKSAIFSFIVGKGIIVNYTAVYACRYSGFLHWVHISLCF